MAERKSDKDTARIEALKARIIALEDVCEHLLKARACRISERERAERRKAEWDAGLPQRLAVFQEKFIEKRCILGRGRAVFQVFIAKAYR